MENRQSDISGNKVFYLKEGLPIDGQIPLTLKWVKIPSELRSSAMKLIEDNGNRILRESELKKWFEEQGLEFGQD